MFKKLLAQVAAPAVVERSRESLPPPPVGMAWWQDEDRKWNLIPADEAKEKAAAAANQETTKVPVEDATEEEELHLQQHPFDEEPSPTPSFSSREIEETPQVKHATTEEMTIHFDHVDPDDMNAAAQKAEQVDVFAILFYVPPEMEPKDQLAFAAPKIVFELPDDEAIADEEEQDGVHVAKPSNRSDKEEHKQEEEEKSSQEAVAGIEDDVISMSQHSNSQDDWEILSDAVSVAAQASVLAACLFSSSKSSSSSSRSSGSYQPPRRTPSNSTMDSTDFGAAGKGVLGVDYVEHVVLPTDTLQGICLAYRIPATNLRRANHFSGNSLAMAPQKLVIPLSQKALKQGFLRVQDTESKEYKVQALQAQFAQLGTTEAKAYLELADWSLSDAIQSTREDLEWNTSGNHNKNEEFKSGQIRMSWKQAATGFLDLTARGAGLVRRAASGEETKDDAVQPVSTKTVATKTVKDLHAAAEQHNSFGVELQSFINKSS